jgi:hypothetical protein
VIIALSPKIFFSCIFHDNTHNYEHIQKSWSENKEKAGMQGYVWVKKILSTQKQLKMVLAECIEQIK